jgi:ketosteroid isomerase-like protein
MTIMAKGQLSDADVNAIARRRQDFLAALHADDVDGLLAPLTDECLVFPPNESPLSGVDGSRRWHQTRIAQFTTKLQMSSDELAGSGDYAYERLSYVISLTPRTGGPAMEDKGCCFWIWHRDAGGSWKIARAIWNSENPMAAAV